MKTMVDLYSGLGGTSEAFVDDPGWRVIRVENNEALSFVPHTRIADASWALNLLADERIEYIHASPPCIDFSQAFEAPGPRAKREGVDFQPDLSEVLKAKRIIDHLAPKYWTLENVVGAIKWISPILGPPMQILGPFVLWGNIPPLILPDGFSHTKRDADTGSHDPLRSNRRALVPIEISAALLQAVELPTLEDFT